MGMVLNGQREPATGQHTSQAMQSVYAGRHWTGGLPIIKYTNKWFKIRLLEDVYKLFMNMNSIIYKRVFIILKADKN